MLRMGPKSLIALVAVFTLCTCIDTYTPKLEGYESLLVVDGLITDENLSYSIKLSNTIQQQDEIPDKVSDASVYVTDENNTRGEFINKGNGIYKSDSTLFRGSVGKTYVLHIITNDGKEYESEPCTMQSVPEIDSIYFVREQELINNGTETVEGIRIYLDSDKGENNKYFRWEFEETWEFKTPDTRKFDYINENTMIPINDVHEFCWKTRKSDELLIHAIYPGETENIEKEPIFFIGTNKSDRLLIQYSILIKQYSISQSEFDFWNNLKDVNESGEDIFASLPFPVISNLTNVGNPNEQVLGYFQVSAVKKKRKNISLSDIVNLDLPYYQYPCRRIEDSPNILPWVKWNPPLTWNDIYYMYTTSGYTFVEPKYLQGTKTLDRLVFTTPECADCAITGTLTIPEFLTNYD